MRTLATNSNKYCEFNLDFFSLAKFTRSILLVNSTGKFPCNVYRIGFFIFPSKFFPRKIHWKIH